MRPNGDLIVGGLFASAGGVSVANIARPGWSGPLPNGRIVVSGDFNQAGGLAVNDIAEWNGSTWQSAPGVQRLVSARQARDGSVLAVGDFTAPNQVARWQNGAWQTLGPGFGPSVAAQFVHELPGGDVVATGVVLPSQPSGNVSWVERWNGANWTPIGAVPGLIRSLAMAGPALLVGRVQAPSGSTDPYVMSLATSCANCTLHTTPDLLVAHVPTAGTIETALAIPPSAALAGTVIHHQIVCVSVAPNAIDLTSTDALRLGLGSF